MHHHYVFRDADPYDGIDLTLISATRDDWMPSQAAKLARSHLGRGTFVVDLCGVPVTTYRYGHPAIADAILTAIYAEMARYIP